MTYSNSMSLNENGLNTYNKDQVHQNPNIVGGDLGGSGLI